MRHPVFASALLLLAACRGSEPTVPDTGTPTSPPPSVSQLPGSTAAPAGPAVPALDYQPVFAELQSGAPTLPQLRQSTTTALVAFTPDATIGGVNALLTRLGATIVGGLPASATGTSAVVALRLPSRTHVAMATALGLLRAAPEVQTAMADAALGTTRVGSTGSGLVRWNWQASSILGDLGQGTFAHAGMRIPQLWNLRNQVEVGGSTVPVGVMDVGFTEHADLAGQITEVLGTTFLDDHGTQVNSVIAAVPNNGIGFDGIAPFARLTLKNFSRDSVDGSTTIGASSWGLIGMIEARPLLRAINLSLGFNWKKNGIVVDAAAETIAERSGNLLRAALEAVEARRGNLPVIVAAAGNDDGVQAIYGSPFTYAGTSLAAIITVASDTPRLRNGQIEWLRSSFSNNGGDVSAPGERVPTAFGAANYALDDGTSFAAPAVTGLVAWMYALEATLPLPTRSTNPVRDLLVRTRAGSQFGRAFVDGFAAAMALDSVTGTDRVLRRLLDVDDGTLDGNMRRDPFTNAVRTQNDIREDADIDMADFRHWRDLVLQFDFPGLTDLDGGPTHPKKDANGDGEITADSTENLFPQADFNGDGRISRSGLRAMTGALRDRGALTDLQVLQSRFSDPDYQAADLDGLIASGDVHLSPDACVRASSEQVRIRVVRMDGTFLREHVFRPTETRYVLTVPVTGTGEEYLVVTARLDQAGAVVSSRPQTVRVTLGGDIPAEFRCEPLRITTTTLPVGRIGQPYSATMAATGASGPIVWGNLNGTLPAGLGINASTGVISGTPTAAVSRNVVITANTATDSTGRTYAFVVSAGMTVPNIGFTTDSGVAFSAQLTASNAPSTPTWALTSGALPGGLTLSSSGRISGTSTAVGSFNASVTATAGAETATGTVVITVAPSFFTVNVQLRTRDPNAPFTATIVASTPGLTRDNGGPCGIFTLADKVQTITCSLRLRRGSSATFTVQAQAIFFQWINAGASCTTGATCTVLFDDPSPVLRSRTIGIDFGF